MFFLKVLKKSPKITSLFKYCNKVRCPSFKVEHTFDDYKLMLEVSHVTP